ncbi:MAG: acetyl-CoA carboxylase carboxyltransferase subunit beta [Verrucomicrobia bacterium]|jgi:acetyl-CoA carboxylase carboxyl transferase subunit beta|nr:acetyl-CoA carboxylase carboxyltransferase subunit beta [Verrucomicrobiota bacterium]MBT7066190.1 acetyl-CoA carboxylase carboxyltransferase subunit beta [Verrucomicrobiota bacterium]MBT7698781.1 acetyl-CoA carboxylase carboxyltransferase subunit beta [Verrucomicrobiota bacterium]
MAWFRKSGKKTPGASEEDLWTVCPSCKAHIYKQEWEAELKVCPKCNYHARISCTERRDLLIDAGTWREYAGHVTTSDPLVFSDAKGPYKEKAAAAKAKTGLKESVLTGDGKLGGIPVSMAIMDFRFLGGSLASGTGEKITLTAEHAARHRWPFIIFSASGGARMHEGIISLMQMAKTCAAIARLNELKVPYISVLTDPTTGGVSASFAMMGDINIAEPRALIGFAGRRVIEETIKQKLPDDFQTAEYLLEHGFIDHIVSRKDMKEYLHRVLQYGKRR